MSTFWDNGRARDGFGNVKDGLGSMWRQCHTPGPPEPIPGQIFLAVPGGKLPGGLPSSGLAVTVLESALGLSPERCPSVAFGAVLWGAPSVVRFVVRFCVRFRRPILRPILFRPDRWAPQHEKIVSGIGPRTLTVAVPLPDTESGMKSDIKSDIKSDRAPWTDRAPDGVCVSAKASGTRSAAHAGSAQFSGQGPGKIGRPLAGEPMRVTTMWCPCAEMHGLATSSSDNSPCPHQRREAH